MDEVYTSDYSIGCAQVIMSFEIAFFDAIEF